jgi:hypothetical protein
MPLFALQQRVFPVYLAQDRKKSGFQRHFSAKSAGAFISFM